jgi:hypothetical protein
MAAYLNKLVLLACCATAGVALAQQSNPLLGEWRGVAHSADNYNVAFDVIYYPNNTFVQTMAVPPSRETGTGSGVIYSRGQYRLTSDHTVEWNVLEMSMCPGGDMSACTPMPPSGVQTISFRMDGPDKVVNTDNGFVSYRVR